MTWIRDSLTIAQRDIIRNFRQKSQIWGAVVRPILWLFFLGAGLRNGLTGLPLGVNLQQYAFPGIIAMNILYSGVMSGASIIWDREFGFLREIQVAPVSRTAIICGKILSGSTIAMLHGLLVLLVFPLLNLQLSVLQIALTLVAMIFIALSVTTLGVFLASRLTTIEGFGSVNNFFSHPNVYLKWGHVSYQ